MGGRDAGPTDDKRDADNFFIHARSFAEKTMAAKHVPMVTGMDDERPGRFGVDRLQHAANLRIAKAVAREMLRMVQVGLASGANQTGLMGGGVSGPFPLGLRFVRKRIVRIGYREEKSLECAGVGFGRNEGVMRFVD